MCPLHKNTTRALRNQTRFYSWSTLFWLSIFLFLAFNCKQKRAADAQQISSDQVDQLPVPEAPIARIPIDKEILVNQFFKLLDAVVLQYDTLCSYPLTENLLLRANPWMLDTLMHTDYYYQASKGNFVYQQTKMLVLKPGDTLLIPGPKTAQILLDKMAKTWIDINIPAYELRIMEQDSVLARCSVRVGKNQKKHLELAGHFVDLRTRTGTGSIFRVNRDPIFIDPVTGKRFKFTKRDDQKTTLMPQIPWLEPFINGQRYGQLIHPTTNPRTLGKPASNGCIGLSEADAWQVYFYAPLGTRVLIRYDLTATNPQGDTLRYEDIYRLQKSGKTTKMVSLMELTPDQTAGICNCDSLF